MNRKRIVCPALSSTDAANRAANRQQLPRFSDMGRTSPMPWAPQNQQHQQQQQHRPTPQPLAVTVRVLYFSKDGQQADNGEVLNLDVSTSTTVEALLFRAREAAGTDKGKLLFKMRALRDLALSLEAVGVAKEPKSLHLMLKRKDRPPEVVARAAAEAEELTEAMQAAHAEAAAAGRAVPKMQRLAAEAARAAEDAENNVGGGGESVRSGGGESCNA